MLTPGIHRTNECFQQTSCLRSLLTLGIGWGTPRSKSKAKHEFLSKSVAADKPPPSAEENRLTNQEKRLEISPLRRRSGGVPGRNAPTVAEIHSKAEVGPTPVPRP
jgi:hypothetical protein